MKGESIVLLWPWRTPSRLEYAVICWFLIVVAIGAAVLADDTGTRVLCLAVGLGTLGVRYIYVRFTE